MTRQYFAFLRAINVTNRFVKMADLRPMFERLGLNNVQTYIQSGNVVFDVTDANVPSLTAQIEVHLKQELGFDVPTFIRNADELNAVANYKPFPDDVLDDKSVVYVSFFKDTFNQDSQEKLQKYASDIDTFHFHQREIYWLSQRSVGLSKFSNTRMEGVLGVSGTQRNMKTIYKMMAKYL
ncbi:MAG: DUF1697 domain-containing protein [Chloroflexota bacterium]